MTKKMYNIIIWGAGDTYNSNFNLMHHFLEKDNINVVGIMTNDAGVSTIDGIPHICKKDLNKYKFDYILLAISYYNVWDEAESLGIRDRIIPVRALTIPDFEIEKWIRLKEISILSVNCFGGHLYHNYGLEFLSPTINLWFPASHFNKFVNKLDYYLEQKLTFVREAYDDYGKCYYPIGALDDIEIHFNHYKTFDDAKSKWEERAKRINRDNIVVVSCTDQVWVAEEFEKLNYKKKIIFVPFDTSLKSAYTIQCDKIYPQLVDIGKGRRTEINLLDFLLNGEIKKRTELL